MSPLRGRRRERRADLPHPHIVIPANAGISIRFVASAQPSPNETPAFAGVTAWRAGAGIPIRSPTCFKHGMRHLALPALLALPIAAHAQEAVLFDGRTTATILHDDATSAKLAICIWNIARVEIYT